MQEKQGVTVSANLLNGLGIDERLSRGSSTVLTDALGSTVGLASGAAVATRYGYDPYGSATITGAASTNPFQFTGREADSGTGLLNYRNRYYNPAWGRFVSEDPIGLGGGINTYRYVANNPLQLRDPSGFIPNGLGPSPAVGNGLPIDLAGGFEGICSEGGSYGTTAMYQIDGINMCRQCAIKYLKIGNLSGSDQAKALAPYLR